MAIIREYIAILNLSAGDPVEVSVHATTLKIAFKKAVDRAFEISADAKSGLLPESIEVFPRYQVSQF